MMRLTSDLLVASEEESFTFHELRHTAAAFMVDEGADPLQLMRRMGHSRTTYNLYGDLFPDREDELVGKLEARYRKGTQDLQPIGISASTHTAGLEIVRTRASAERESKARQVEISSDRENVQWA